MHAPKTSMLSRDNCSKSASNNGRSIGNKNTTISQRNANVRRGQHCESLMLSIYSLDHTVCPYTADSVRR